MHNYLDSLAEKLVPKQSERIIIIREVIKLEANLSNWKHSDKVKEVKIFGSYARLTNLPQKIDKDADVDVMIIFKDAYRTPKEDYYKMLMEFAHEYYGANVLKDEPSIVLLLSGFKIELTPGVEKGASINLQIPTVNNQFLDWTWTDPFELIREVEFYNKLYKGQLLPLIRLFKLWNVNSGHYYPTYKLETYLARLSFFPPYDIFEMFVHAARNLPVYDSSNPETVTVLKTSVGMLEYYKQRSMKSETLKVLNAIFNK